MRALISSLLVALLALSPLRAQSLTQLPAPILINVGGYYSDSGNITIDAANEYAGIVGQVYLAAGSGTKTCSSSGCAIHMDFGSVATFANGSTNLRIGIQDVGADGFGDATFDVFADLVGGVDAGLTGTRRTAMESGTKSITHGDIVAVQATMTARGGADSLTVNRVVREPTTYANLGFPYAVGSTGTPAKNNNPIFAVLEFDDGTFGWIDAAPATAYIDAAPTTTTFGNASTPDEYAFVFKFPFDCEIDGFAWMLDDVASGDNYEYILYTNPLVTPAEVSGGTITMDPDLIINTANQGYAKGYFSTPKTLTANTLYALAIRPTTANTITIQHYVIGSSSITAEHKVQPFTTWGLYSRSDQTGAFALVASDARLPLLLLSITKLVN